MRASSPNRRLARGPRRLIALIAALAASASALAPSSLALAAPPPVLPPAVAVSAPATPPAPRPGRAKPKAHLPETPALPVPELKLTIDAPSPDGPWTLHLDNAGTVPLRALADARLLAFEISPPEASADEDPARDASKTRKRRPPRPVRCALPSEMRPRDYEERALVVPAGRSYVEKLDPRLFCFGARNAAALVPGATVVAHLVGSRESEAVEGFAEVEPKVGSVVDWAGAPAVIGSPAAAPPAKDAPPPQPVAVSTPGFVDVGRGWEAEVPTTVRALGPQSVAFLFRPETVAFEVTGPSGVGVTDPSPTARCVWPGRAPVPIPEAYTHLAPKQSASITILLDALCPEDTLRRPGLYVVRARLVTLGASGASVGVRTFTGDVAAAGTTRLRVRSWNGMPPPPAARPQLVELAPTAAH